MNIGATSLRELLLAHPSIPQPDKDRGYFNISTWLSYLTVEESTKIFVDLPEEAFIGELTSIHRYLLEKLSEEKASVNDVLKFYTDKGFLAHIRTKKWWDESQFDKIILTCLQRYHELSELGRKQLHDFIDALHAHYNKYRGHHCYILHDLQMGIILAKLARKETLTDQECEGLPSGNWKDTLKDIPGVLNRFGKNFPGAKELLKGLRHYSWADNVYLNPEEVAELSKLKAYLPPKVLMEILDWNQCHSNKEKWSSDLLFDLVMRKSVTEESKSESVREEKEPLSQRLAAALIQYPILIARLNLEHATVILNHASEDPVFKLQQLLEANNPLHLPLERVPLERVYFLESIGIKEKAAQKAYEGCTSLSALITALKADGHGEEVAKLLEKLPSLTKQKSYYRLPTIKELVSLLQSGSSPITSLSPKTTADDVGLLPAPPPRPSTP